MADFVYPVKVPDLIERARKRGGPFIQYLGVSDELRDDLELTAIVMGVSKGWFPADAMGAFHGGLDIGLPDLPGDSYFGAEVFAVGEGEVIYAQDGVETAEGYDYGRVIVRHPTPAGADAYALYQHLRDVKVVAGEMVAGGDPLGKVGWHGDFPHLHFAVASQAKLGGAGDLIPEASEDTLPADSTIWNVQRVKVQWLDPVEWPMVPFGEWYLYNPIQFVRWCRGEEYQHYIGKGSSHAVATVAAGSESKLKPGDNVIEVKAVLQSKVLGASSKVQALAVDPTFTPIARGGAKEDPEVVSAIQRALKVCGYDLGRFGPAKDGVDGDYGKTCERVVTKFQTERLQWMDLSVFGRTGADVRLDGQFDWLTLMGLDIAAAAHEKAAAETPPKPPPKVEEIPPSNPKPDEKREVTAPPSGAYIIDGAAKKPSLQLGMRMYKALLNWEWKDGKGTGYSTCTSAMYGKVIPAGMNAEWPNLGSAIEPTKEVEIAGQKYPAYTAWGLTWKGTGFTNCCNSQMAALFYALGGKTMSVKYSADRLATLGIADKAKDGVVTFNMRTDDIKVDTKGSASAKKTNKLGALIVTEQTWVNATRYYDTKGNCLQRPGYGGMQDAVEFLGIGQALTKFSNGQDDFKKMRVGDLASYEGHAWLVGDVRYGVWLKGNVSAKPDYVVEQSSFIDSEPGKFIKLGKNDKVWSVDGRKPMDAKDCDWIASNEATFEARVAAFLAAAKLKIDGTEHDLERKDVVSWRVFSANGSTSTGHNKWYVRSGQDTCEVHMKGAKDTKGKACTCAFTEDAAKTKGNQSWMGITRGWAKETKKVSLGRLYGPAAS